MHGPVLTPTPSSSWMNDRQYRTTGYDNSIIKSYREQTAFSIGDVRVSLRVGSNYYPHIAVRIMVLVRICHGRVHVPSVSIDFIIKSIV